ncbi:gas vesicle protein K [Streptomyces purpureus]|uniref:Gas vesicle protein K n=1 Tax=Streptomyces purpureus TaxID=1951 RepID=A0A918GWW5_9ACTN|nr:gas vesicle protein K [Streptomyces purpureus]GGT15768.1 hypothetical protein GCM10014713_05750 [Streptomyces purpureus]
MREQREGHERRRPPGGGRLDEVSDAATRAFRLLAAAPRTQEGVYQPGRQPVPRLRTDRENVERDPLRLVLTVVELLRQLMERQALRRVDAGDLTDEQEEELGAILLALHEAMVRLCEEHGLTLEDLNLDLGPLGRLLPPPE